MSRRLLIALPLLLGACQEPEPTVGGMSAKDLYVGCVEGMRDNFGNLPSGAEASCHAMIEAMVEGAQAGEGM